MNDLCCAFYVGSYLYMMMILVMLAFERFLLQLSLFPIREHDKSTTCLFGCDLLYPECIISQDYDVQHLSRYFLIMQAMK